MKVKTSVKAGKQISEVKCTHPTMETILTDTAAVKRDVEKQGYTCVLTGN
jgi:hypothetical protein